LIKPDEKKCISKIRQIQEYASGQEDAPDKALQILAPPCNEKSDFDLIYQSSLIIVEAYENQNSNR
jgi:hypothetical protein